MKARLSPTNACILKTGTIDVWELRQVTHSESVSSITHCESVSSITLLLIGNIHPGARGHGPGPHRGRAVRDDKRGRRQHVGQHRFRRVPQGRLAISSIGCVRAICSSICQFRWSSRTRTGRRTSTTRTTYSTPSLRAGATRTSLVA